MKRLALSLAAILIALLCSACFTTGGSPDDNPPAGDNRPASTEPTDSGTPAQETLAFGQSYTWEDGVTVTVGKPKEFKPSETAAAEKANAYVRFTVTVVNKSDKPLDLGLTYITVQSSNKEAEEVFDSEHGLESTPDLSTLLAGTAMHIGGIGAVLEVVLAAGRQRGLKRRRPVVVGLGQPPHLIRGQAEVADYLPEGLAVIDGSKELPPRLDG